MIYHGLLLSSNPNSVIDLRVCWKSTNNFTVEEAYDPEARRPSVSSARKAS